MYNLDFVKRSISGKAIQLGLGGLSGPMEDLMAGLQSQGITTRAAVTQLLLATYTNAGEVKDDLAKIGLSIYDQFKAGEAIGLQVWDMWGGFIDAGIPNFSDVLRYLFSSQKIEIMQKSFRAGKVFVVSDLVSMFVFIGGATFEDFKQILEANFGVTWSELYLALIGSNITKLAIDTAIAQVWPPPVPPPPPPAPSPLVLAPPPPSPTPVPMPPPPQETSPLSPQPGDMCPGGVSCPSGIVAVAEPTTSVPPLVPGAPPITTPPPGMTQNEFVEKLSFLLGQTDLNTTILNQVLQTPPGKDPITHLKEVLGNIGITNNNTLELQKFIEASGAKTFDEFNDWLDSKGYTWDQFIQALGALGFDASTIEAAFNNAGIEIPAIAKEGLFAQLPSWIWLVGVGLVLYLMIKE